MTDNYILDKDKNPILEPDIMKWAEWLETSKEKRLVSRTELKDIHISTVFLGLDHSFGHGKPILYETMVFENKLTEDVISGKKFIFHKSLDEYTDRYHNKEEALIGHDKLVAKLKTKYE